MSSPVERISVDSSLVEGAKKLLDSGVGSLLVFDGDRPVGIITRHDIVEALVYRDGDLREETVSSYVTEVLVTIESSQSVGEAINTVRSKGVKHVAVTEGERPVGVVSTTDIALHCPDCAGELLDVRYRERLI